MIKKIKKSITNFSNDIFPYYSKSSKLNGISSISINSHIYHALVSYHLGNTEIAKKIANKCINQINIQNLENKRNIYKKHSSFYKDLHKTALLTQLICSLENDLKSGQILLKKLLNKEYYKLISNSDLFINKIKSLELVNSWHDSNIIMSMFCLRYVFCDGNKKDYGLNACIRYLEEIQNIQTGFWHSRNGFGGKLNAMAGTYHYLPLFMSIGKSIPKSNLIIESTIKLHTRNGHFSLPNGHSCIDLDVYSIFYYCILNNKNNFNKKIEYFSKIFSKDLKNIINNDGGFSDFPSNYKPIEFISILNSLLRQFLTQRDIYTTLWNIKSIIRTLPIMKNKLKIISNSDFKCSSFINESNIFSCWFKLLSIDFADNLNKDKKFILKKSKYKLPFLGFGI